MADSNRIRGLVPCRRRWDPLRRYYAKDRRFGTRALRRRFRADGTDAGTHSLPASSVGSAEPRTRFGVASRSRTRRPHRPPCPPRRGASHRPHSDVDEPGGMRARRRARDGRHGPPLAQPSASNRDRPTAAGRVGSFDPASARRFHRAASAGGDCRYGAPERRSRSRIALCEGARKGRPGRRCAGRRRRKAGGGILHFGGCAARSKGRRIVLRSRRASFGTEIPARGPVDPSPTSGGAYSRGGGDGFVPREAACIEADTFEAERRARLEFTIGASSGRVLMNQRTSLSIDRSLQQGFGSFHT